MMNINNYSRLFAFVLLSLIAVACSDADGNNTGTEYVPDMTHSIAYDANLYADYSLNTWNEESVIDLKKLSEPHPPVAGTVPRGYAGVYYASSVQQQKEMMDIMDGLATVNGISIPTNGKVPFYYGPSEEERTRAIAEIQRNPFPITENGLNRGKALYDVYCGICHGEKGDGQGYLVSEDNPNAKYPAQPANFLLDEHLNASNGRYYFAIMYGKNVMGPYKDKLNYEERWQVIHYIRALQAQEKKLAYDAENNTLNAAFGVPAANASKLADVGPEGLPMHHSDVDTLTVSELKDAIIGDHDTSDQ